MREGETFFSGISQKQPALDILIGKEEVYVYGPYLKVWLVAQKGLSKKLVREEQE